MLSSGSHNNLRGIFGIDPRCHFYKTQWDIISNIFFQINKTQSHIVNSH